MSWSVNLENISNLRNCEEVDIREIKNIELQILLDFAEFCDKNNLRYVLAGGTLLGAIRHQGFIPWDDDIDVLMPRPDYEKFQELTQGKYGDYTVRSIETHPKLHTRPFIRVVNDNYMTELITLPKFLPPWLDVFPMDGLPEKMSECVPYFKEARKIKWLVRRSWAPYEPGNPIRTAIKKVAFAPLRLKGHIHFLSKLQNYGKQLKYDECKYVGCIVGGGHGIRERVPRESFDNRFKVKFEGYEFWAPEGYDLYLSNLYGKNYMGLPSEEEREIHIIKCWKVK
ncbi:LicD family protein [Konateibacter massiliensis]|uniref:LicD family protein n=1 Tax=Konateibacter massiliensis TaxID=2002841 RepID=UPI000C1515E1|nr:LicD family protein [Konateibacter massiliensis]